MGNNKVLVTAPVNSDDIVETTAYANHDWGHFCSGLNANINRWAMFKPIRSTKLADLTIAERKAASYGLSLVYIAQATSAAVNIIANPQASIPNYPGWTYLSPRTYSTDVYRINDFVNNENPSAPGYNKNAKPPMSGFADITVFQSEFGSEIRYYNFNFKWGSASYQGMNDTSGIEIPITELMSDITNGTWRFALLIFFPNSANGKYQVWLAGSPAAISNSLSNPGDMLIRPAGTGQLSYWYNKVFNEGTRELTAIPILAKDISRGGVGNEDRWMAQASSQFIGMPNGEKIKIKLSARFANVSITFNSIVIKYLNNAGAVFLTYTLTPTRLSTGMHKTQFAAPSAYGALRCQIELDFNLSGSMASSDYISIYTLRVGFQGSLINTFPSVLERYNGESWGAMSSINNLGGRWRLTATDTTPLSARSDVMNYIENLPRRDTYAVDLTIHPALSFDGALFNTTDYIIHHG